MKERDAIVTHTPATIFPEYILIRVNEFNSVAVTPLEEWMRYLKEGVINKDTTAPGLSQAREKLRYYSMTPQERRVYDEHLNAVMIQNDVLSSAKLEGLQEGKQIGIAEGKQIGIQMGIAEGKQLGIEEGKQHERLKNAANMKKLGIAPELIAQATGLTLKEIEKL